MTEESITATPPEFLYTTAVSFATKFGAIVSNIVTLATHESMFPELSITKTITESIDAEQLNVELLIHTESTPQLSANPFWTNEVSIVTNPFESKYTVVSMHVIVGLSVSKTNIFEMHESIFPEASLA